MVTTSEYENFIKLHENQLTKSGVPKHFWPTLYKKLSTQCFDTGDTFMLGAISYEEEKEPHEPKYLVQVVDQNGINHLDAKHIYLVDHAWSFKIEYAKNQLINSEYLRNRMADLMGVDVVEDPVETAERVFDQMWRYAQTYMVSNVDEEQSWLPVWYVPDELGAAVYHSDTPNCRMVPFFYITENITYSLLFPIVSMDFEDVLMRDYAEGIEGEDREAVLLPWRFTDFTSKSFTHVETSPDYFLSGHIAESLPILDKLQNREVRNTYKVYTEYSFVREYLKDPHFILVDNEEEADILWLTRHFKTFEELSQTPEKFVNQFPFEYVLTVKDLLCITCRRNSKHNSGDLDIPPKWLPATYNLKTELTRFISYFQNREKLNLDNHWIVKPFNLARGLDTHITNNINFIIRLSTLSSKIVQKYIQRPVLFKREDVGEVKFDIRYVILLKSVKPLSVYVYKNFFLRFSNKPFALNNFDDYEQHFTVMNYTKSAKLLHMKCAEFLEHWGLQYTSHEWVEVEKSILSMLREVFECASVEPPPCGISESPQSRALYAVDLMLEWDNGEIKPKILEINWTPDCKRACEYYPDFYDNIFKLLFLNDESSDAFHKL